MRKKNENQGNFDHDRLQHAFTKKFERDRLRLQEKIRKATANNPNKKRSENVVKKHNGSIVIIGHRVSSYRPDMDNAGTAILDCLVKAGHLNNDNIRSVSKLFQIAVKVPEGHEGADIIIIEED
jgi:Holliday junction resolvase RusA-like endonuclease